MVLSDWNIYRPGGACTFESCTSPACEGGRYEWRRMYPSMFLDLLKIFFVVISCNFKNHIETLKEGYCGGGNCRLDGNSHPDLQAHVSY